MLTAEPEGRLAAGLVECTLEAGAAGLILIVRGETRAARLQRALRALTPADCAVWLLPGWDCLPYDSVSPSRAVMGRRMALPAEIAAARGPRLLIASVEAASQRLPCPDPAATLRLEQGAPLDPEALRRALLRLGYVFDEWVDEPGEAAIHGEVVDVFPPGGRAWRLRLEAGRIEAIHRIDLLSQRNLAETDTAVTLGPASELLLPEEDPLLEVRPPGLEHALPAWNVPLVAPLALLPEARIVLDDAAEAALERRRAEVAEAFRTRLALRPPRKGEPPLPPPEALYLDAGAWTAALAGRRTETLLPPDAQIPVPPRFAAEADPQAAFLTYAEDRLGRGGRLAIAGGIGRGARRLAAATGRAPLEVADWPALRAMPPGSLALLAAPADLPAIETEAAIVVPYASIRPGAQAGGGPEGAAALIAAAATLQPGDTVIHLDHGLGALRGVEAVEAGGVTVDCLRLNYADGSRLIPFDEFDRLWRYGAEAAGLALDRLEGGTWPKRRAEAETAVAEAARALLALVREREATPAPVLRPPPEPFARLAARFPYELTPDQAVATAAALADLASGRPMDRLVCGDVGFGKTEVALRAAAAAALAGKQVAVLAPTTVLVRQHLADLPPALRRLRPEHRGAVALDRAGRGARDPRGWPRARCNRHRHPCARGEGRAIPRPRAARGRRGTALRRAAEGELQALRRPDGLHVLTLTATPIPRTLQAALVGLQRAVSVIATPPAQRQPVRTLRAAAGRATVREALLREARRGGQSFVVCPRIEDIAPMRSPHRRAGAGAGPDRGAWRPAAQRDGRGDGPLRRGRGRRPALHQYRRGRARRAAAPIPCWSGAPTASACRSCTSCAGGWGAAGRAAWSIC